MNVYAQVALPLSSYKSFTYRVPPQFATQIAAGSFVEVPFRRRSATVGVVASLHEHSPFSGKVKSIRSIREEPASLPPDLWNTLEWVSRYYLTPLGVVLKMALPLGFSESAAAGTRRVISITGEGRAALSKWRGRAPVQRAILEFLLEQSEPVPLAGLRHLTKGVYSAGSALAAKGWVSVEDLPIRHDPFHLLSEATEKEISLTDEQQSVLGKLLASIQERKFSPYLLQGVTGSGKTEIYLKAAREVVEQGGSVIVLVPEIALTPQVAGRFRAAFGAGVALWHSHLSRSERTWTWQELMKGTFSVVVGARSAIFAPIQNLRLLIVDEEQEGSYKQEDPAPRYHARDAALMRGKYAGATVLLTSATPSLESYYNGLKYKYSRAQLTERFGGATYPGVQLVDLKLERQRTGNYQMVLSEPLIHAIQQRLQQDEQVILLQNRRGYAPLVTCNECGYTVTCPHCSIWFTYHKAQGLLKCHHCGTTSKSPEACPECASPYIFLHGVGTEQVEEQLHELFPSAAVRRLDMDTTRRRGAMQAILQEFARGDAGILLGTQMIAKGLDFENVTLVGVVNADMALFLPDFRATERTFQLVYQVCGRSGRRQAKPGEAIIQTNHPDDVVLKAAARLDAHRFYNQILAERQELLYPPFSRLARFLLQGQDQERVWEQAHELRSRLTPLRKGMQLLGPASAPYERLKGKWRVHLLLKSNREIDPAGGRIHQLVEDRVPKQWLEQSRQGVRLKIDIDPQFLL